MSKQSKSKRKERSYSAVDEHRREGKKLIPPLLNLPNLKPASWINDRLPEVLWAAILISHLPRELALAHFRRVADFARNLATEGQQAPGDLTHSGL